MSRVPNTPRGAEVGVLTVTDEEVRAVRAAMRQMYDFRERPLGAGPLVLQAWLPAPDGRRVRVAAVRTPARGTDPAAFAYLELVEEFNPATVLLVGIADGPVAGDVVISDEGFPYNAPDRGDRDRAVSDVLGRRLDAFFAATPALQQRSSGADFQIHRGPIDAGGGPRGRLTVRGITGAAGRPAGDGSGDLAARHAAAVMAMLVPHLHVGGA